MKLAAACRVSVAGALVGDSINIASVGLALNVFTITLSRGVDALDSLPLVQIEGTTQGCHAITQTSDTVFEVRFANDAGAPTNYAFSFGVLQRGIGAGSAFGGSGNVLNAAARVSLDGTSVAATVGPKLGYSATSTTGAGQYLHTLGAQSAIDTLDAVPIACVYGTTPRFITGSPSTDTTTAVRTRTNGGVDDDSAHTLALFRARRFDPTTEPVVAMGLLNGAAVPAAWYTGAARYGWATAVTDNGAGDWTVTLSPNNLIDKTNCVIFATPTGGNGGVVIEMLATDNTFQVRLFDQAGNPQDDAVYLVVLRTAIG